TAAVAAILITSGVVWVLENLTPDAMVRALVLYELSGTVMTISMMVAGLAAFLTGTGTKDERRLVSISWNLLWIVLVVSVIAGKSTLAGALVSVLLGRAVGLGTRYASGVLSRRAHGQVLVEGIRRAGVDARSVIRLGERADTASLRAESVVAANPIGYVPGPSAAGTSLPEAEPGSEDPPATEQSLAPAPHGGPETPATAEAAAAAMGGHVQEAATIATEREGANRVYAVTDTQGRRWDAVVLDGDRQVIGWLNGVITTITRRGLSRRRSVSLRQSAERASLMYYAAAAAGVNCPRLHGIAEAGASVLLLGEHVSAARQLADLPDEAITDEVMMNAWQQLRIAHTAGLAHRNLSTDTVYVVTEGDESDQVWLNGWEEGESAAGSLARRADLAQLLTLFALRVGPHRAVAAASRCLSIAQLAEIAPLLQPIAMPARTRAAARLNKASMRTLRSHL